MIDQLKNLKDNIGLIAFFVLALLPLYAKEIKDKIGVTQDVCNILVLSNSLNKIQSNNMDALLRVIASSPNSSISPLTISIITENKIRNDTEVNNLIKDLKSKYNCTF